MIRIMSNYSAIDAEIDRIADLPDSKATAYLDAVLGIGEGQVKAATHVITGSLKGSVKSKSAEHGPIWEGTITAGGVSVGINNPVDYAIYEKARGGDHDFFGNLHLLHSLWVKAVLKGLEK